MILKDVPRANELATMLTLVCHEVPDEVLGALGAKDRYEAGSWAMAVHLSASDNDDVVVPPRPAWLAAYESSGL